ncbi:hypothetical protein I310_00575 [Cryptococcus deuterogattii CA1014]|nr:hypothetical protein I310_00575 [Cryptococcus deuterogattii CA1014]
MDRKNTTTKQKPARSSCRDESTTVMPLPPSNAPSSSKRTAVPLTQPIVAPLGDSKSKINLKVSTSPRKIATLITWQYYNLHLPNGKIMENLMFRYVGQSDPQEEWLHDYVGYNLNLVTIDMQVMSTQGVEPVVGVGM